MEALLFSTTELKSAEQLLFEQSELGHIQSLLPFDELAGLFAPYQATGSGGRSAHLSLKGGLALMFLKHYLDLSDSMLIDRLNSDIYLQLFCFTRINLNCPIRDKDLPGRWRRFFAQHMDIQKLQAVLAQAWQPHMQHTHVLLDDATCYESAIRYPTDVKLLFECCEWLDREVLKASRFYGTALPRRHHYKKLKIKVKKYVMKKRKTRKEENSLRRSLLHWLDKWQATLQVLLNHSGTYHELLHQSFYERLKTIRIIYQQQLYMFVHGVRKVPHRIVSLAKPYLRPIIRGKENKRYEFGAKVHQSQVDGLNFIEHLSFEAFHEGNRMWYSIAKHKKRFGKCTHYGADRIYATNKNRRKAKKLGVQTSFLPKGRKPKNYKQQSKIRKVLSKERATRLEGSFGTEKQTYGLRRILARNELTEVAWIVFGVHTANVVRLARRQHRHVKAQKQAQSNDLLRPAA